MKITLAKKLGGHDKGATIEVTEGVGQYLAMTGHTEDATEPESHDEPAGNASVDAWREYAINQGRNEEELEGLKRDDIKALLAG